MTDSTTTTTTLPDLPEVLTRGVAEVLPSPQTLATILSKKKIRLYLGIDPTGALLTLGHSVVLRKLQQFADLGHQVILLIGNGTVKIGDPTGRDATRPVLTNEQIEENFKDWKKQASKILNFDKIEIRRNGDWLDKMQLTDFITLMAKTTVQQLIERDMFQERLKKGHPIHTHELMYPLLQGYDSVVMDVDLELGGTDQTFNMMMGRTLQKTYNNKEKWVLTTPIINGTDGRKMSKSYGNYVALTEHPHDMYGKLMSITDDQISTYFTLLTDVALSEIEKMKKAMKNGQNPMEFKKKLAFTITEMYHTTKEATAAAKHFTQVVQKKQLKITGVCQVQENQTTIIDAIKKGPSKRSKSDLRRLVKQGAITIFFRDEREEVVMDPTKMYQTSDLGKVKVGKRDLFMVEKK